MKGKFLVFLVFLLSALLLCSFMVFAAPSYTYVDYPGNYTGGIVTDDVSKTVYFNDDLSVSSGPTSRYIIFTVSGQYLSFSATNILVTSLCVKGADNYRIYTFNPAAASADSLCAPLNGGGNIPAVSHYVLIGVTLPPVVTPTETPTLTPTDDPTLTPTETPTLTPTETPTLTPTETPTLTPTETPTIEPTLEPTASPTETPTVSPSPSPTTGVLGTTKPPTATPTTTVLGAVKTGEANYQTTIEIAVVLLAAFGTAGFVFVFRRRTSEE